MFLNLMIGLILGYVAGYHWKSFNPNEQKYDILVYVGYPILAIIFTIINIIINIK